MAKELKLQDPGEGIHEVEIRAVLVAEGDEVSEGDPVLTVESDKAAIDIPAPYSGNVARIAVSEGDTAQVGDVLMTFDDGAAEAGAAADDEAGDDADGKDVQGSGDAAEAEHEEDEDGGGSQNKGRDDDAEQASRDEDDERPGRAAEAGSGKTDTDDAGADREEKAEGGRGEDDADARDRAKDRVLASPAARRAASKQGVDLDEVEPTGPGGRVLREDVEKAAGAGGGEAEDAAAERGALPDFSRWGPVERQKLRSIRRATARQMARSWAEIPHVTHQDAGDITEIERFRRRHADEVAQKGGKLTLTAFALKAAAAALKDHPRFNASLDAEAEEVILKQYCNIGVAVETEQGLLVPAIRDVDRKSLIDLSVELTEVSERARAGKLKCADMQGASFTVTNVGALGGTGFAPIINHPEVAILGLARASWQLVVEGDPDAPDEPGAVRTEPRLILPLVLGYDHRVLDGADAARFLRRLATTLADVESFALLG